MPDVTLSITIPDAHTTRVLDAFTKVAGAHIEIMAHGDGDSPEDHERFGHWSFTIDPKGVAETQIEFGERVLRTLGIAVLRLVDYAEDQDRYRAAVATIPSADQDVPDNILE